MSAVLSWPAPIWRPKNCRRCGPRSAWAVWASSPRSTGRTRRAAADRRTWSRRCPASRLGRHVPGLWAAWWARALSCPAPCKSGRMRRDLICSRARGTPCNGKMKKIYVRYLFGKRVSIHGEPITKCFRWYLRWIRNVMTCKVYGETVKYYNIKKLTYLSN